MGISCGIRGLARIGMELAIGSLVEKKLVDFVAEVRRKSDRIIAIKVVVGSKS